MLNEQQLVQAAESATGSPLIERLEASLQSPGQITSQRGLLGATHAALVFVEDQLLRAGAVTVWKLRDITGHSLTQDLLYSTLTIHLGDTQIHLRDLQPDKASALLASCGLSTDTVVRPPTERAEPTDAFTASLSASVPSSTADLFSTPSALHGLDFGHSAASVPSPQQSPVSAVSLALSVAETTWEAKPEAKSEAKSESPIASVVQEHAGAKEDDADDEEDDADDEEDDEEDDDAPLDLAAEAAKDREQLKKLLSAPNLTREERVTIAKQAIKEFNEKREQQDRQERIKRERRERKEREQRDKRERREKNARAKIASIEARDASETSDGVAEPTASESSTPKRLESVSDWYAAGSLLLLLVAIAIPVIVRIDLQQTILGIRPDALLSALGDSAGLLILAFYGAAVVTVLSAPGTAMGFRPTVFWSTTPMVIGLLTICFGVLDVYPNPKHPALPIGPLREQLQRLRITYDLIPIVALLAAYLYGLPLVGVLFRALQTDPAHRPSEIKASPLSDGDSQTPLLMIGSALIIPFVSCLYVQRASHAQWAILIALAFVIPSALMVWRSSQLPKDVSWLIGGSPAAFIVQGLLVFVIYFLLQHRHDVIPQLDALLAQSPRRPLNASALDALRGVLSELDLPLLRGLLLSQLGVVLAALLGHRSLAKIDDTQKISPLGWLLTLGLLLTLAASASHTVLALPERVSELFDQARSG